MSDCTYSTAAFHLISKSEILRFVESKDLVLST